MDPELGLGAAVITNGNGGPLLIREVLRALAAECGWPDYGAERVPAVTLDAKTIATLTGTYHLSGRPRDIGAGAAGWRPAEDASGRAVGVTLNAGIGGLIEGKRTKLATSLS